MDEFKQLFSKSKRNKLFREEKEKLEEIFKNMDEKTYKTSENLIEEAAFLSVTLAELRMIIARDGPVEPYQNGEHQKGIKKSAAVEAYDKMVNTYAKMTKQLVDLLPKTIRLIEDDSGDVAIEEVDDDSASSLLAYVTSLKR